MKTRSLDREGEISVKELKGLIHSRKRKPPSIKEMHEVMMRAVAKANLPSSPRSKKRR